MRRGDHRAVGVEAEAGVADRAVLREAVVGGEGLDAGDGRGGPHEVAVVVVGVDAAQPRGGAVLADLEEVVVGQRHQRPLRSQLVHRPERAPVEGLDGDLALQAGGADLLEHPAHEQLTRRGLLGCPRLDLRLDVERDLLGPVALDQVQHVPELCHPGAVDLLLPGVAGQLLIAAVHGLDLSQRQILDVFADVRVHGVARHERRGVPALLRADLPVVRDHHLAVLGDLGVQLQRGHPPSRSALPNPSRVLSVVMPRPPRWACKSNRAGRVDGSNRAGRVDGSDRAVRGDAPGPSVVAWAVVGTASTGTRARPARI
ncbi:hypothetical protein GCM10020295_13420 [Streptomyces cinereospinus]